MSADEQGYKRGRAYTLHYAIEKMTFAEYQAMGRATAQHDYQREKARQAFLLGWWHAGEQAILLFKQDDTNQYGAEQRVKHVRLRLGSLVDEFQILLDYREGDIMLQTQLLEAVDLLTRLQDTMDGIAEYIKQSIKE